MNVMFPPFDSTLGPWYSAQTRLWQSFFTAGSNPVLPNMQQALEQRLDANREAVHTLVNMQLQGFRTYLNNFRGDGAEQGSALGECANHLEQIAERWAEMRLALYDAWFENARALPALMNTTSSPGAGQSLLELFPLWRAWQATMDQGRQWQSLWNTWMIPMTAPTQTGMKIKEKGKSTTSKPSETERAA